MEKATEKKLAQTLKSVFDCALGEEMGNSEHITEYVGAEEIKNLCEEIGFDDLAKQMEVEIEKYL